MLFHDGCLCADDAKGVAALDEYFYCKIVAYIFFQLKTKSAVSSGHFIQVHDRFHCICAFFTHSPKDYVQAMQRKKKTNCVAYAQHTILLHGSCVFF